MIYFGNIGHALVSGSGVDVNQNTGAGIRRDIQRLADGACTAVVLSQCDSLLALRPVQQVLYNYDDDVLRTHVLREFLRSVADHAGLGDRFVKGAASLLDVSSRYDSGKGARQKAAADDLSLSWERTRQIENQLVAAFADAVLDFISDPEAVKQFDGKQRRWITINMPEPGTDRRVINALGQLLSSDDPVDGAFLSRLTFGRGDEKAWRNNMRIHYNLRWRLNILRSRLQDAIDTGRESPELWARRSYDRASLYSGDMVLVRTEIYMKILTPMTAEPFDEKLEKSLGDCICLILEASPETDDGAWFQRLRDPKFWEGRTDKEVAGEVPIVVPNAEAAWREFLLTCHCAPGDEAAESTCGMHIFLHHCETASELAKQILMGQLTDGDHTSSDK